LELLQSIAQCATGEESTKFEFIALQDDFLSYDRETLSANNRLIFLGNAIEDFDDLAALVALCDLVISADTAVAHLAGAMGKPLWLLKQFAADWHWMNSPSGSPWYPDVRIFRQPTPGDWGSVITKVVSELRSFKVPAS
jgi:hypothetical protein